MDKNESSLVQKLKNELYESDSYIEKLNLQIQNETLNSDKLRKELNILMEKNNSLAEYISESQTKFSEEIIKYKNEISNLNKKIEFKLHISNENDEKMKKVLEGYENCKTELNLMNINMINYQQEIQHKNSIIHELEKTNVILSENINHLSEEIKNINSNDKNVNNNFSNEIQIAEKTEELENVTNKNIFLIEEIDQLKKRNSYLDFEISRVNHINFELQTCINTIKNSKHDIKTDDKYCCCVCF
jgi:chromosome segregation ATPase